MKKLDMAGIFRAAGRMGAVCCVAAWVAAGLWAGEAKGQNWTFLENQGAPMATYYVGDMLAYEFYFQINNKSDNLNGDAGIGTSTDGSGWTWFAAYRRNDTGDNSRWESAANAYRFTAPGNYYYVGRNYWDNNPAAYCVYSTGGWAENRTTLSASVLSSYFEVEPLNSPRGASATATGETSIALTWTPGTSGEAKDTLVVRYESGATVVAPTDGTPYGEGSQLGAGTVVFKRQGGSWTDNGVSGGTTYVYYFYAENNGYYSTGVSASATTPEPVPVAESIGNATVTVDGVGYAASAFNGATIFVGTEALLGARVGLVETGGARDEGATVVMGYKVDGGADQSLSLSFAEFADGVNWYEGSMAAGGGLSLSGGAHSVAVWFAGTDSGGLATVYDSNNSQNYTATVTVPQAESLSGSLFSADTGSGATWYNGSGSGGTGGNFNGANLDLVYSLTLGGRVELNETGGYQDEAAWVRLGYRIDGGTDVYVDLAYAGRSGANNVYEGAAAVELAGLADGTHTLTAWFVGTGSVSSGKVVYDSNYSANYVASFRTEAVVAPETVTGFAARGDGKEMVRLGWTRTSNSSGMNDVLLVARNGGAVTATPATGTTYAAGDVLTDGSVVLCAGAESELEWVTASGATWHFAAWSRNPHNGLYSVAPARGSVTLGAYGANDVAETFSYTNGTSLGTSAWAGGAGWSGGWTTGQGTLTAVDPAKYAGNDAPVFGGPTGYPESAGNVLKGEEVVIQNQGTKVFMERKLGRAYTEGTVYVAFLMAYQYEGARKWAGVSLTDGSGNEVAFFGKGHGQDWFTLCADALDGNQGWGGNLRGLESGTSHMYLVVGKYDFSANTLQVASVLAGDGVELPGDEPEWAASCQPGSRIRSVGGVAVNAGGGDLAGFIGSVWWDEIRVAGTWADLVSGVMPLAVTAAYAETGGASLFVGDWVDFKASIVPAGFGQWVSNTVGTATKAMTWVSNSVDGGTSWWSNRVQVAAAGSYGTVVTLAATATAGAVNKEDTVGRTMDPFTVAALGTPGSVTATKDAVKSNSVVHTTWTPWSSGGRTFDVMIARFSGHTAAEALAAAQAASPVGGKRYAAGESLGAGTVAYVGDGSAAKQSLAVGGLLPDTYYAFAFYSLNGNYYSAAAYAQEKTDEGGHSIVVDGEAEDWYGEAPLTENTGAWNLGEYIWLDKTGEERKDSATLEANTDADIVEFRAYADEDWMYFLVKMKDITDQTRPYVAIGMDTRRSEESGGMNWLGDESATGIGGNYWGETAAEHYPERQVNVHWVNDAGQAQVELYAPDSTGWYAPVGEVVSEGDESEVAEGWAAEISAEHDVVEVRIPRSDLGLDGMEPGELKTVRFTVASFLNTGAWNNQGTGTREVYSGTSKAVDSLAIAPQRPSSKPDNDWGLGSWDEDISDGVLDFWVDVGMNYKEIVENRRPATPALVSPINDAELHRTPTFEWTGSEDTDGEVTGYLLEVATEDDFGGEHGSVVLRVNVAATNGAEAHAYSWSGAKAQTMYYWRVRARDTAGQLSASDEGRFHVVSDSEGPIAVLRYVGTNVMTYLDPNAPGHEEMKHQEKLYPQSMITVTDKELLASADGEEFGFVIEWTDPSGVFATNRIRDGVDTSRVPQDGNDYSAGNWAWNIIDGYGRVSPNWDLVEFHALLTDPEKDPETDTDYFPEIDGNGFWTTNYWDRLGCWGYEWGYDRAFHVTNTIGENGSESVTNYFVKAFTTARGYDPSVSYYLTVSAEDCTIWQEGKMGKWAEGSWKSYGDMSPWEGEPRWTSSGFCADGPYVARNITTNQLLPILVTDNDSVPPTASTRRWTGRSVVVTTNNVTPDSLDEGEIADILDYNMTSGGVPQYMIYDGGVLGRALTFHFNVYDSYMSGLQIGREPTSEGRFGAMTNTAFVGSLWGTNWANYTPEWSELRDEDDELGGNGLGASSVLTWHWEYITPEDVTKLWGMESDKAGGATTNMIGLSIWDCDDDRAGDQTGTELALASLVIRDDDTVPPSAPYNITFAGNPVELPFTDDMFTWTNSLAGFELEFDEAIDGEPDDEQGQDDIEISGVGGYRAATSLEDVAQQLGFDMSVTTNGQRLTGRFAAADEVTQGISTNYLYAFDSDADRLLDALTSEAIPFPLALDRTPPPEIKAFASTTDGVDDPTTQFALSWSADGVGPDNPEDPFYQRDGFTGNASLSPWKSYKIYYGTNEVANEAEVENPASEVYSRYVESGAYQDWPSVTADSTSAESGAVYEGLADAATAGVTLCDLDYDQEYVMVIVGTDEAGNESGAGEASWTTNNTIRFAVTQGCMRAYSEVTEAWGDNHNMRPGDVGAAALYWFAATNAQGQVRKDYDLISMDASRFDESRYNTWRLVGTVQSNWFTDARGLDNAMGTLRFYRAAYKDRWRRTVPGPGGTTKTQRPLMSEDVYAMSKVALTEGANYISLHGYGADNTLGSIFGTDTNMWPTGDAMTDCVRVDVYGKGSFVPLIGEQLPISATYYLGPNGIWYEYANGTSVPATDMVDTNIYLRGCSVVLPSPLPEQFQDFVVTNGTEEVGGMYWYPVLKVPTNYVSGETMADTFSIPIQAGSAREGIRYNLCSVPLPGKLHPAKMNLLESGFRQARGLDINDPNCDILYAYDTVNKSVKWGTGMFCDKNGTWRSISAGHPVVTGTPFGVNDMLIIWNRSGTPWTWTFKAEDYYALPTRWGGW